MILIVIILSTIAMNGSLIENVNIDYSLCCNDVNSHVDMCLLHMPLYMSTVCKHTEENDESIIVIPSSKKEQLSIIFGKT